MPHMLILGLGYTTRRFARALARDGWRITATRRAADPDDADAQVIAFDDLAVPAAIAAADAIISSVPPARAEARGEDGIDVVLEHYGAALADAPARWIGYLSATGVYGDTRGAWVDETSPVGHGRRTARAQADLAWQALAQSARAGVHIFRLPGIYGPQGRSALDRVREGRAHRIRLEGALAGHVFSRIHVDDIVAGLAASLSAPGPAGQAHIYNLSDDEPASGNAVTEYACDLLGLPYPPLEDFESAGLGPMARGFYSECRRVANNRMKQALGISLSYPTYREGLRACLAEERTS